MATCVLIAEDEPHIVESLSFVLEREGFTVRAVLDGDTALRAHTILLANLKKGSVN